MNAVKLISLTKPVLKDAEWVLIDVLLDSEEQAKVPCHMRIGDITNTPKKITIEVVYGKFKINKLANGIYCIDCVFLEYE